MHDFRRIRKQIYAESQVNVSKELWADKKIPKWKEREDRDDLPC